MAVASHGTQGLNVNGSAASLNVAFFAPSVVTAGDIWICTAVFRGGSTVTISSVQAGFNLIKRTDSGSATTNASIASYWYVATGNESAGTLFGTINISASSKFVTMTDAFSGCSTTAPVSGTPVSVTALSTLTTALPALTAGQAAYASAGLQGASNSPVGQNANATQTGTVTGSAVTTGGSLATDVGSNAWFCLAATDAASQGWKMTVGSTTQALQAFVLAPAPAAPPLPVRMITQAVNRSANY